MVMIIIIVAVANIGLKIEVVSSDKKFNKIDQKI